MLPVPDILQTLIFKASITKTRKEKKSPKNGIKKTKQTKVKPEHLRSAVIFKKIICPLNPFFIMLNSYSYSNGYYTFAHRILFIISRDSHTPKTQYWKKLVVSAYCSRTYDELEIPETIQSIPSDKEN